MAGMLVGAALLTSHGLGRFYARASTLDFGSPQFLELVQEVQIETFHEVFVTAGIVMAGAALISVGIGRTEDQSASRPAGAGTDLTERGPEG
jgi:hypothetical protein